MTIKTVSDLKSFLQGAKDDTPVSAAVLLKISEGDYVFLASNIEKNNTPLKFSLDMNMGLIIEISHTVLPKPGEEKCPK